ncbi:tetratricopeptide repeat protein [Stenotrophobium rhamnosiphilum]|uniref:Outer membrane lipoprotein BamD-like domain-containing protein n=1 Tax=Stenotrophobium rhamnosiphilum TaxID=2029166 RepID=A0A2T5MEC9_9GAMM|nr:tetratricopeptide repeat protein [Stenotrophobium rhamnosiphilum]PTU30940.1 hypothetical protein CJD38_11555 [Stenotrophobium rhamnosiphilum]
MKQAGLLKYSAAAILALQCVVSSAADNKPSTVGSITHNNGLNSNGVLQIATPTILRVTTSKPLPPNPREALIQYDRLIELNPDPVILAEALRRSADLRVQMIDASGDFNEAELRKAIFNYKRLLSEIPTYQHNDRVLYQLARAYQLAGDNESAINSLKTLVASYPDSLRIGDAAFRSAELLFASGKYDQAEPLYRAVFNLGKENPLYRTGEYKYGWTLYKQSKYEQALAIFIPILDRDLPAGELTDSTSLQAAPTVKGSPYVAETLRVTSLSFAALGGGKAINDYFAKSGRDPRYYALLYSDLGSMLMDRQRYTDAAETYASFIARYPKHTLAPDFQTQVIAAYRKGGFNELTISAKETYVNLYAPGSAYWGKTAPPAKVLAEVRQDLSDLGSYYHARAQKTPLTETASRQADFSKAASWYKKTIEAFPDAPQVAATSMLYADALYDGGQTEAAAQQYAVTAYTNTGNPKAAEAAYAGVQAWQRLAREVPETAQTPALLQSIAASLKLADTFPQHPKLSAVLARAANDLYAIKDYPQVIVVAQRAMQKSMATELRRETQGVLADAYFAQQQYPQAEIAYTALLPLLETTDAKRSVANEQLAASIYKQGEAAREAGDLRAAANHFQRVARIAPGTSIQANSDYDAAAAFINLQDWKNAESTLETFLSRYPKNALAADADKKLAFAYQKDNRPLQASEAYARIAARSTESADTRRDAAWLAAQLSDKANATAPTARAYEYYVSNFPQPLDRAMTARRRLADLAHTNSRDDALYQRWLRELIDADTSAAARTDVSKQMAAQANLEIGQIAAAKARALALSMPVNKSLPKRKSATEVAIASFERAASYGYANVTTAATYEIGMVYRDFGRALLDSPRPAQLQGDALEQYNILLEEQANPFEEKAISIHEANLQRLRQGLWNDSIKKSVAALADLSPAKYGKREQRENSYDSLR